MFGFKRDGLAYLDAVQAKALENVEVRAGDVLLNITGASIGRVTIAPKDMDGARVNQHVCIVRPFRGLDTRFLRAYLSCPAMQTEIRGEHYGVTRPALTKQQILEFQIPLAPVEEQRRIADKLDALLARVDACRARLDRVPAILKKFREAVLEAAVSGRLTEEWRGEHGSSEWQTVNLSSVCRSITDGDHQAPPRADKGVPFITISAINDGRLRLEKATRYVPESYYESLKAERKPRVGDILFSVTGSIAIPALVDLPGRFTFQRHIAILKPDTGLILSRYLLYSLGTRSIADQAQAVATGIAQLTVPLSGLRAFTISLPPVVEQTQIVRRVDELFALADGLEAKYRAAVERVERITPAVLAKAFRGELVPQDPGDEAAEKLLERIREMRKNMPAKKKKGRVIKMTISDSIKVTDHASTAVDSKLDILAALLRKRGRMTPEALLQACGLEIDAFYDQLKLEEQAGRLREVRKGKGDIVRFLEAKP